MSHRFCLLDFQSEVGPSGMGPSVRARVNSSLVLVEGFAIVG